MASIASFEAGIAAHELEFVPAQGVAAIGTRLGRDPVPGAGKRRFEFLRTAID